ncbi:methionine aminopeptidase 1D, mitochondrial-like [Styela clava]
MFIKRLNSIPGKYVAIHSRCKSVFSLLRNESAKNDVDANIRYPYQVVQPGHLSPIKAVPEFIAKPDYRKTTLLFTNRASCITINSEEMIRKMKETCLLAKHVLQTASSVLEPGVTTDYIDEIVHAEIIKCGAYPSTLHYKGYPKSCCTSVNNVACHGIPDDTILQDGDIINIDITVFYLGCHGDTSDTFQIGNVDETGLALISSTRECLNRAIDICKPGAKFSDIPEVIEPFALEKGLSVCKKFVGHGIGQHFHTPPNVWHVKTHRVDKRRMEPGMIFTIEPILMEGDTRVKILSDGWTTVSRDNLRSAQAEHTVLITQSGHDILTL